MSFYVYILHCGGDSYYVGHTDELEARLWAHQHGFMPGYTLTRQPVELVWCDSFATRDEAFARERQLKGWSRAKKEALIAEDWERLPELALGYARRRAEPPTLRRAQGERRSDTADEVESGS